jgi:hypothetical protein
VLTQTEAVAVFYASVALAVVALAALIAVIVLMRITTRGIWRQLAQGELLLAELSVRDGYLTQAMRHRRRAVDYARRGRVELDLDPGAHEAL